jgi:hypothetical protein
MPRPRTPKELAKVTGAAKVHPGRFAKRSDPQTGPLGPAPAWMSAELIALWEQFSADFPWLQRSDRYLLALTVLLWAKVAAGEEVSTSDRNQLRLCLSSMGGTPADRSKVTVAEKEESDPTDVYFN